MTVRAVKVVDGFFARIGLVTESLLLTGKTEDPATRPVYFIGELVELRRRDRFVPLLALGGLEVAERLQ